MSDRVRDSVLGAIRKLFAPSTAGGPTDAELLRRFARERDEAAFELLVWRHAGLVLTVCRQVLRHDQAVGDAFQATFLVLGRKGRAIRAGEALPRWRAQVAYPAAPRAPGQRGRRDGGGGGGEGRLRPGTPAGPGERARRRGGPAGAVARGGRPPARQVPGRRRLLLPPGQDPRGGRPRAGLAQGDRGRPARPRPRA